MNPDYQSLRIGVSACFMHADPQRALFTGKTLQYLEQSTPHWIASQSALAVMIPAPALHYDQQELDRYAQWLDALVLEGGADMWPGSYGEQALQAQWNGDRVRDEYEIALIQAFAKVGKPIFGICRGLQVINVAFGGSLYQDIATLVPKATQHRDGQRYDQLFHPTEVLSESRLARLVGAGVHTTNSVHHQGINRLAEDFVIEARCSQDGIAEAIRRLSGSYVAAVQWHPEFHHTTRASGKHLGLQTPLINDAAILSDFLEAALDRKHQQQ